MTLNISLTKITDQDLNFLFEVYASTRIEELAQTGWSADQQLDFLQMQFDAQHQHYQKFYPKASFDIVSLDQQAVGRLYVSRWPTQIRIIDIALLTEFRSKKVGSQLMTILIDEAKSKQLELTIHVEKNNPALSWYQRLGFKITEDKGIYHLMKTQFFSI